MFPHFKAGVKYASVVRGML